MNTLMEAGSEYNAMPYGTEVLSKRTGMNPDNPIQLVGLMPVDARHELNAGAHFLEQDVEPSFDADQGWMTSVAYSPSLQSSIGLGFIINGQQRIGDTLIAADPVEEALQGYSKRFAKTTLTENSHLDIVSIAIPQTKHAELNQLLESKVGLSLPETGERSSNEDTTLLGLQTDQCFLVSEGRREAPLERICPIDLGADVFQANKVARTSMEHLNVIVHPIDNGFRLFSARSSANSFLHAVTESLRNVSSTITG